VQDEIDASAARASEGPYPTFEELEPYVYAN
jgi:hypothetical protein